MFFQKFLLSERSEKLKSDGPFGPQKLLRVKSRLHAAVVALDEIVRCPKINNHWKEIVGANQFRRIELGSIFSPSFFQETVTCLDGNLLMITPSQKNLVRVRHLQSKQRVKHFDPIRPSVCIIT